MMYPILAGRASSWFYIPPSTRRGGAWAGEGRRPKAADGRQRDGQKADKDTGRCSAEGYGVGSGE